MATFVQPEADMLANPSRPQAPIRARGSLHATRAHHAVAAAVLMAGAVVSPPVAGTAAAAHATWRTVFSDHFTGPAGSPADSKWTYDTGTHYHGTGCPAAWGTGEVENYTRSAANVHQDGHGHLLITPVKSGGGWTSGRVETVPAKFAAPARSRPEMVRTAARRCERCMTRSPTSVWMCNWVSEAGTGGGRPSASWMMASSAAPAVTACTAWSGSRSVIARRRPGILDHATVRLPLLESPPEDLNKLRLALTCTPLAA